jgi:hypothetical protein
MNWKGSVKIMERCLRRMNPDLINRREVRKFSCYGCAIAAAASAQFKDAISGEIKEAHKPEYESINALERCY